MGIAVLGPVQVGGSSSSLGHRDRVLLSALALQPGEVLSPDRLADALWGEDPPRSWPKVVQGSMSRLRRVLGPQAIETTGGGYRLCVQDDEIDALRFEQLVTRARGFIAMREPARAVTAYEQALSLWRGPAFGDLEGWDTGRAEAARLLEARLTAEEELVAARMAMGHHAQSVGEARRLTTREPYREHRWALLALALYRCGNQQEALSVLRRARTTLREELGLDPGAELIQLEQSLLRQDPELRPVPALASVTAAECPYRGLRAYGTADAETFFGRDEAVATCLARLDESPLLLVAGPSGSGKSSLIAAGVVPALIGAGRRVVQLTPGVRPLEGLRGALAGEPETTVVVVDQLEELFHATDQDVVGFLELLVSRAASGALVVVGLRADHLGDLAANPAFARLAERGLLLLTPMSEAELQLAIGAPATRDGLLLEPGLVDLLVRDVLGEPGGLPLLSHALAETWERREGNVLTVEGYTATGGIRAAVAQSAERLYDSLPAADRDALRTVLLRLVTPMPTGDPVGSPVPTRVFAGAADTLRLLDVLVRARLVTADADTVAIAHESLTRAWPRMRAWLDEDVEGQRIFQHLQVATDGWEALGHPPEELYRGARLQSALEWRQRAQPALTVAEAEFLESSEVREQEQRVREDRQLRQQVRHNRQLRAALAGVIGLLIIALVAGTMASNNGRRARGAAATADAARLGTEALVQAQTDTALLLARQAVALADTATTRGSLLETLGRQRGLVGVVQPNTAQFGGGLVNDELVSPDGSRLLMNGDKGVYLIDTATGKFVGSAPLEQTPDDYAGMPYPTGFVDGGRSFLVSRASKGSGSAGKVELQTYTAADGKPHGVAEAVPGSVQENFFEADRLRVSPDGQVLLSLLDRRARVWKRSGSAWEQPTSVILPRLPTSLPDEDRLLAVSFSKDDSRAAILLSLQGPNFGQPPEVGIVLATDRPRLLMPVIAPIPGDFRPSALALSRDGTRLAVGHGDGRVTIQDVAAGTLSTHIPGHTRVTAVAWGDTNDRLVVGHDDGSVQVVDPARSLALADFPATGDNVSLVALRMKRLVIQTNSGAVTVRSLDLTNGFMTVIPIAFANAVAAGPAGSTVAVGGDGGAVTVYDQTTLHPLPLRLSLGPYEHPDTTAAPASHRRVSALAISSDGKTLVAADRVGHLRLWSLPDGRQLWSRDDVPTSFLALSPDGHYLATSGFTQDPSDRHPDSSPISTRVSLWDLRTRKAVLTDQQTGDDANPNTQKPRAIAFSPDSASLAVGFFEPPLAVYDVARHARRLTIDAETSSLVFAPDSRELLVEDFGARVHGYEARNGKLVESFPAPSTGTSHLLFTADGQWLVGSNPTSMSVWQADTHRLVVSQLPLPSDGSNDALSLATTSDRRLFVATQTSLASITMDAATWSRLACSMAGRALTQLEWTEFLPGRPYRPACAPPTVPQGAR